MFVRTFHFDVEVDRRPTNGGVGPVLSIPLAWLGGTHHDFATAWIHGESSKFGILSPTAQVANPEICGT